MDLGLGGAHVVVSGGTKGMGRAAARCFATDGANVAVLARGRAELDETLEELRALGSPDPMAITVDVTSTTSVNAAFAEIGERYGALNSLVNTVGPVDVGVARGIEQLTDDEWIATFEIGTMSAVRCVRAALPLLRAAEWARIVNVSAHSTKRQTPSLVAYTASKAAMTSLSKNLSLALAPDQILVNTVSPGSFLSEGMRGYLAALPPERGIDPNNLFDAMRVIDEDFGHPAHLGRAGDPNEIGPVIAFVASRANSYMTGADVNVDGGSDFELIQRDSPAMDKDKLAKLFDLTGRVAIVTGGTRGIGRAVAEGYAAGGAKVVVASRKADACAETEAHLVALGGEALGVATHMGEIDAVNALVAATVDRFGGVDIVVNNAANALTQPLGEFTPEAWNKSYDVNLRGPVFLLQAALPYLTASPHAAVINVISAGAFLASSNVAMYGAAKAGMMSFTRSMAAAWAPLGIRVNALAPGTVETDMVHGNTPEAQERMRAASPMKRGADPDEMVGPAVYLASDASSFMTGQVLLVDGGMVPH